jgi:hypothetical protein
MSFRNARVKRLEARQRRHHPPERAHFTSVVRVPPEVPYEECDAWLEEQPCACGQPYCPERRIGLLAPAKCQTAEEWQAYCQRYARRTEAP